MNQLSLEKRTQIISTLVEGNGIRATARIADVAINTVVKLLIEIGPVCAEYLDKTLVNLKCKRVQCDEIWAFCYAREKNVPEKFKGQFGYGDVWTWTAIDADSKLIVSYLIGPRDPNAAREFIDDVAGRLTNRVQLTTDGLKFYVNAVEDSFGKDIDYGILRKIYGAEYIDSRASVVKCIGAKKKKITGKPDWDHISTSYVERQNLTMRMGIRRFTRLTNGFSKKLANHQAAIALHFTHYNFCRVHQTLRVTPAMEVGIADHVWRTDEMIGLIDSARIS